MISTKRICLLLVFSFLLQIRVSAQPDSSNRTLKVIIIRHGEKPFKGDNLTCQGLNRSMQLPAVLNAKFGIPQLVYVPSLGNGESTKHARMFETVAPFAAKYNLTINSSYAGKDFDGITKNLTSKKGNILIVWDHKAIPGLAKALGVTESNLSWDDNDYDSIWIIEFTAGSAAPVFKKDTEGLSPAVACPF